MGGCRQALESEGFSLRMKVACMDANGTILIAEDDLISQQVLRNFLSTEGFRLEFVDEGTGVMARALALMPELILLDVMLPGVDGFTLCKQLRGDPKLGDVPIIMLTALDDDDSRVKAIELGADEFLTKPVNEAELKARVRTITQLYRFRRMLAQRAKFETIIELAPDGIVVVDLEGAVRVTNQAFRRMMSFGESDPLLGRSLLSLVAADKREDFARTLASLRAPDSKPASVETRLVRALGDEFVAECTAGYLDFEEKGSIQVLVRDVSEKKRLEGQFLRMQRLQSVGTLAGGIAHDLKNALTPVLLGVHMARLNIKEGPALRYLDTIEKAASRSTEIIKQILAFARGVEGEKRLLQPQYVLRELDKILGQTLPKEITLLMELPDDDWLVKGDATQIHQVFMNLCVNARDAMPQGGTLTVRLENMTLEAPMASRLHTDAVPGSYVCTSVTDTGTGIPPSVMDKLFEPFVTTKEVGRGTGLGLSSALGIVRSHGGFITVDTALNQGTTFRVFLPAVKEIPAEFGEVRQPVVPQGHGETVLVVDDEPDIRMMLRETLEAHGYKVLVAENGAEALALFARHESEISIGLVDFRMPVLDGVATVTAIQYLRPSARVILLSEQDEREEMRLASDGLHLPRLVKPFSVESLLRHVHAVLNDEPLAF